ncbi:hypothetical protein BDP27DRAFT_1320717, partial [Rhodocollybia butyracea]
MIRCVSEVATKVRNLNQKLNDIRMEQRDWSESMNSRAVWYSVVQIAVLILM